MNSSPTKIKAILFDFDGTLLDSFPAHYEAFKVTLAHFDVEVTPELYKQTYSPNWLSVYEAFGIPQDKYEEADNIWLAEARKHKPQLFPEVRPLLESLRDEYSLGLVTSGSRGRVLRDLTSTGIREYFQVLVTGDNVSRPKPDPEGLLIALEELTLQPEQALFVGDAREDYLMAQAAGVPFMGVIAGFATVSQVKECSLLENLSELVSLVEERY
ncbi:MAG: HAD family hydrolase [Candidatus Promineifilaceae bacterium]|jgi:HAD superfamily hydrolase (TIGR01549 family)